MPDSKSVRSSAQDKLPSVFLFFISDSRSTDKFTDTKILYKKYRRREKTVK